MPIIVPRVSNLYIVEKKRRFLHWLRTDRFQDKCCHNIYNMYIHWAMKGHRCRKSKMQIESASTPRHICLCSESTDTDLYISDIGISKEIIVLWKYVVGYATLLLKLHFPASCNHSPSSFIHVQWTMLSDWYSVNSIVDRCAKWNNTQRFPINIKLIQKKMFQWPSAVCIKDHSKKHKESIIIIMMFNTTLNSIPCPICMCPVSPNPICIMHCTFAGPFVCDIPIRIRKREKKNIHLFVDELVRRHRNRLMTVITAECHWRLWPLSVFKLRGITITSHCKCIYYCIVHL